jgi:hydrogenase maturation factor
MCVSVPLEVLRVYKGHVLVEGNMHVMLEKGLTVTPGDYVSVVGRMATRVLSKKQGKDVRIYIRSLIDV